MKKFLFLSSAFIMTVYSAFADDAATTDKKITGGAGTCTVDVLGVSDNNATANTIATWSLNSYECVAGQYLDETTLNCTECPTGSYCPGGVFTVEANNSKNTCPADYTSDAAATAESECYMGCELACTQQTCPAHSTSCTHIASNTTGRQYMNSTCDAHPSTCAMEFTCEQGYTAHNLMMSDLINDISANPFLCDTILSESCHTGYYPGEFGYEMYQDKSDFYNHENFFLYNKIVCNEYSPDTPGAFIKTGTINRNHFYQDNGKTYNVTMLYSDNFVDGNNGKYCWVRPVYVDYSSYSSKGYYALLNVMLGMSDKSIEDEDLRNLIAKYKANTDYVPTPEEEKVLEKYGRDGFVTLDNMPWFYVGEYTSEMSKLISDNYIIDVYADYHALSKCTEHRITVIWHETEDKSMPSMCLYGDTLYMPEDPVKPGYTFTGWKLVESTTTTE